MQAATPCLCPELIFPACGSFPCASLTYINLLLACIYSLSLTRILWERKLSVFLNRNSCSGNKCRESASEHLLLSQPDFYTLQNCKCGFQAYLLDSFPNVHCRCTIYLQWLLHMLIHTYICDGEE